MKHPQANISVEGQGWNPYAVVAEGKDAFVARVIADGHYQRGDEDIPLSEDERKTIGSVVFDKAQAYVDKHKPKTEESPKSESKKEKDTKEK